MFQNSDYITENLTSKNGAVQLPLLESADLNLRACAFKFLIVLFLCYNIVLLQL